MSAPAGAGRQSAGIFLSIFCASVSSLYDPVAISEQRLRAQIEVGRASLLRRGGCWLRCWAREVIKIEREQDGYDG